MLTTSILVEPNHPSPTTPPPPPATLTPLSHFSKLPCPPLTHPKLGSHVNYKIFPSDLLYTPLTPQLPCYTSFFSVRSPHGVWQEVNFSPPPPNPLRPLPSHAHIFHLCHITLPPIIRISLIWISPDPLIHLFAGQDHWSVSPLVP